MQMHPSCNYVGETACVGARLHCKQWRL